MHDDGRYPLKIREENHPNHHQSTQEFTEQPVKKLYVPYITRNEKFCSYIVHARLINIFAYKNLASLTGSSLVLLQGIKVKA